MARANIGDLISVVADDPEVKDAARSLALAAIAEARQMLHQSQPTLKLQLIRSLLPTALASLKDNPENEHTRSLRDEMDALFKEMRDG